MMSMRLISDERAIRSQLCRAVLRGMSVADGMPFEQFEKEVLSAGAVACLPVNLEQRWLDLLCDQADATLRGTEASSVAELLAAVILILEHQRGLESGALKISESDLLECIDRYRIELFLEEAGRKSGPMPEPATLESMFTTQRDLISIQYGRLP